VKADHIVICQQFLDHDENRSQNFDALPKFVQGMLFPV
jgi:hypothetical protein